MHSLQRGSQVFKTSSANEIHRAPSQQLFYYLKPGHPVSPTLNLFNQPMGVYLPPQTTLARACRLTFQLDQKSTRQNYELVCNSESEQLR